MISIITSLYNSNLHLEKYVKNIEKSSEYLTKIKVAHEFILIFNSPNDGEKNAIEQLRKNTRIQSRIIICERESLYATWNRGIREAQFPNITFWNVDDSRFSSAIIDGLEKIKSGADVVYFPFIYKRYIKAFGIKILVKVKVIQAVEFNPALFLTGMHIGPFFMTTKGSFEKAGAFDESFKISGDFDWAVRAAKAKLNFVKSKAIGGIFTNDGTTLSGQRSDVQQSENKRITDMI